MTGYTTNRIHDNKTLIVAHKATNKSIFQNSGSSLVNDVGKSSLFFKPLVQAKLSINQPNDIYEEEADAVAERVMQMNTNYAVQGKLSSPAISTIQRKCSHCEEEEREMQRKELNGEEASVDNDLENYVDNLDSKGQSLPEEVRNFYEPRIGYDFSKVKIHNDSVAAKSAQSINALAYTSGNNIVFNSGQYSPNTEGGKKLLGHELTHVVQQSNGAAIQKQEAGETSNSEDKYTSYIVLEAWGNRVNGNNWQGVADKDERKQLLGKLHRDANVCWEGDYVGIELMFGTGPIPRDGSNPRRIPPSISAKLSYKEAGGFTTYRYEGADANPVWHSGGRYTFNWHPNIQTFFTYPLNKKGTLDIHVEMMDIEDDRLLIYDDKIDFTKCNLVQSCRENALATNRWAVIPDNGDPIHPLTGTRDDGERYEIYKENNAENYFICKDENTRIPVERDGSAKL